MPKGQYRKASIRLFVDTKAIEESVDKAMDAIAKDTIEATNQGIKDYLEFIKEYAMNFHPWDNRTGNLRASHEVIKTDEGWALKADPRAAGFKDYDYGGLLEFGFEKGLGKFNRDFAWIRPTHEMMKSKLPAYVLSNFGRQAK
jgi:hypothetical protein